MVLQHGHRGEGLQEFVALGSGLLLMRTTVLIFIAVTSVVEPEPEPEP